MDLKMGRVLEKRREERVGGGGKGKPTPNCWELWRLLCGIPQCLMSLSVRGRGQDELLRHLWYGHPRVEERWMRRRVHLHRPVHHRPRVKRSRPQRRVRRFQHTCRYEQLNQQLNQSF